MPDSDQPTPQCREGLSLDAASAFYDFAKLRYESQLAYQKRFHSRFSQLQLVYSALGAGTWILFHDWVGSTSGVSCCVRGGVYLLFGLELLLVAIGLAVSFLFVRARDYGALPDKCSFDALWSDSEGKGTRAAYLRKFAADTLLNLAQDNAQVDARRQRVLERAQHLACGSAVVFAALVAFTAVQLAK